MGERDLFGIRQSFAGSVAVLLACEEDMAATVRVFRGEYQ